MDIYRLRVHPHFGDAIVDRIHRSQGGTQRRHRPRSSVIDMPRSLRAPADGDLFFTADAGGVTPITVAENVGETSGTANINTAKLEINLDAYTSASPLTLINAAPGKLVGEFGTVTFLGKRTATPHYDLVNGDVFLDNFQSTAPGGLSALVAAPEPSALLLALVGSGILGMQWKRQLS
jgi:hypothetical protein